VNTSLWQLSEPNKELAQEVSSKFNISPFIAQILIHRGIKNPDQFLNPRLKDLCDPMQIPNTEKAAKRILLAKEKNEKVVVYGDYDVDGVTGTAILIHTLRFLGIKADYYIPHRYGEGYSLSIEAIEKLAADGANLILTVDCGISNVKEIKKAKELGLEVVVTDHHNIPEQLPEAFALVNPKLISQEHPSRYLAGAGVAFKFAWALLKVAGIKDVEFLSSLLDLAGLGTFSDVVPLKDENRVLAINGLKQINARKRPGIKALLEASGVKGEVKVNNIYFALAPRINAAGRLEHASKSVELLLTDDYEQAQTLAQELNRINVKRRDIGSSMQEEAFAQIDDDYVAKNKLVILHGSDWHPGVIGIVASRIVDRYSRPAVLIGVNEGVGRGSARSLKGVNMYELLSNCKDLFTDFGGHEGAAGFEIVPEKIPELKKRLQVAIDAMVSFDDLKNKVIIDLDLEPKDIDFSLVKALEALGPFGEGNPVPVFRSRGVKVQEMKTVGKQNKHLKIKFFKQDVVLDAIGFSMGSFEKKLTYSKNYDIVYNLESNEWNGFERIQLNLIDIKEAE